MKPAVVLTLNLLMLVWSASHAKKEDCNVRQSSNFAKDAAKAARDIGGEAVNSIKEAASFGKQALQGAADMGSAYLDMREANYIGADKYFHARGNSEAAERGPGGKWAAEVISDTREFLQGSNKPDSLADQEANTWGRNGGDPNKYRPEGLPDKY